jgi:hypothetical protein
MDRQTFKCELFETKQEHRLWLSFVDQGHWEIAERGPGYIATTCERSQGGRNQVWPAFDSLRALPLGPRRTSGACEKLNLRIDLPHL